MKKQPYNLKGANLEVYAALYSLTRHEPYEKSIKGLADFIVMPERSCRRALKYLVEHHLLQMEPITKTQDPNDAIYQFEALVLPDAPLPSYFYKKEISQYEKQIKELQKQVEAYRKAKFIEGLRDSEQEVCQNDHNLGQNDHNLGQNGTHNRENIENINNKENYTHSVCVVKERGIAHTHTSKVDKKIIEFVPYPTTLQEVWDYARVKQPGISLEVVTEFYAHYKATGWKFKHGGFVKDWKAELFNWDQRGKRWEKAHAAKACTRYQQGGRQEEPSYAQIIAKKAMEKQKEAERAIEEEHDRLANTPEAKAAAARVLAKFCK